MDNKEYLYCEYCGETLSKGALYWLGNYKTVICEECGNLYLRYDKKHKKNIDIADCCRNSRCTETFKLVFY